MAINDMDVTALNNVLKCVQNVPDSRFADILRNPQRMTAIREQVYTPIKSKNTHMTKADTEQFFNVALNPDPENKYKHTISEDRNSDRQLLDRAIAFYTMRIRITPEKNMGELRKAVTCFGQADGIAWIYSICQDAGISLPQQSRKMKTEQEKEAETATAKKAVEEHLSGKREPVQPAPKKERPQRPEPPADAVEITPTAPEIGTAFLANDMQFVLYKPSEAYQKPERAAIIKDYFYADTINIFYGQAGSYKTWYAIWEGVSLAIGKTLCGLEIEPGEHKVLYISLEMSAKDIADRITGMTKDMTEAERQKVEENFLIISAEDTPGMTAKNGNDRDDTNRFLGALAQLCQDQRFDILYLDAFSDYCAGCDIRNETDMGKVINDFRRFTLDYHVSFRIIHHGTKPTQDTNGSMAGIHTIRDLVDHVYLVKANTEREITVTANMQQDKSAKSRFGEPTTLLLKFVSDSGSFSFKRIQDSESASFLEKMTNVLTVIRDHEGITSSELRKTLGNPKDLTRILSGMIGNTIIEDRGRSASNQQTKCYYTVEYWNENVNTQQKGF